MTAFEFHLPQTSLDIAVACIVLAGLLAVLVLGCDKDGNLKAR